MSYEGYHEQMRKPYHKEKKFSPKLLGLIVLILVVSIAAFISSTPTEVNEAAGISGFVVEPDGPLDVNSVSISYGTLEFNATKTDSVVLKTNKPSNFKLAGEEIDVSDLSNAEISLADFSGKIRIKDKKITLEGDSSSFYLNTIGLSKRKSPVEITSDFDSLQISNIRLSNQVLDELVGEFSVSEKTKLDLTDAEVWMNTFKGSIVVDESLRISGLADKISVKNNDQRLELSQL